MNGPASEANVLSVSQLNNTVLDAINRDPRLNGLWVRGEISNLNHHSSGHIYFTLKDARAQVTCTFFKNANVRFRGPRLKEGDDVVVRGRPGLFSARGSYQFNVADLRPAGLGEIRQKIEELKRRLHLEGLFDPARKQALPRYPMTLGIATAPDGAAVHDIVRVARSRFASINILLAPCRVQGEGAARSIVQAIGLLNDPKLKVDVIIAGRGGGSFEDLLAFSDEAVVRAVAGSRVPIISAVGHEIDSGLSDLSADRAAATPSAAAEQAVPVMAAVLESIDDCALRLQLSLANRRQNEQNRLRRLFESRVYTQPRSMLDARAQLLDYLQKDLRTQLSARMHRAARRLEPTAALSMLFAARIAKLRGRFELLSERLRNYSPQATLDRGYALVRDSEGQVLRDAASIKAGEGLEIVVARGKLKAAVTEVFPSN